MGHRTLRTPFSFAKIIDIFGICNNWQNNLVDLSFLGEFGMVFLSLHVGVMAAKNESFSCKSQN